MLSWFQALMPKEERFFELFRNHSATLVSGAEALRDLLEGGDAVQQASARIFRHEDEADVITREVLLAVRRTFITPFDRSDIKDLITSLDDAIDQMQKTAKATLLFEISSFEPPMRQMADIIVEAAKLTAEAVGLLATMRHNMPRLMAISEEIIRIEEQADQIYDAGRKTLFLAHRHEDPMGYIVGEEIYSHLEKVVDRFEDVANRISGILIENV
ncbi:MAG: DUF47 domain-containing protein [Phenylobacterium sp.]